MKNNQLSINLFRGFPRSYISLNLMTFIVRTLELEMCDFIFSVLFYAGGFFTSSSY